MKPRRWVVGMLVVGVAALITGYSLGRNSEPRYRGQSLTYWLRAYGRETDDPFRQGEAADAVRHIGTNAIPWLLAAMRYETPGWRRKALELGECLPDRISTRLEESIIRSKDPRRLGEIGFDILAVEAAPAIPELIRMMDNRYLLGAANWALVSIGTTALPQLLEALTNRTNPICLREAAAGVISRLGTNACGTIGVLIGYLDSDPELAGCAVWALTAVAGDPDLVIPALTRAIGSPSARVRAMAIEALESLGSRACCAVPTLITRLTDEDEGVRMAATNALMEVAPEALSFTGKEGLPPLRTR